MIKVNKWRVGRKVGRTVYIRDDLVGIMDTPDLARLVVEAVNHLHDVECQRPIEPFAIEGEKTDNWVWPQKETE